MDGFGNGVIGISDVISVLGNEGRKGVFWEIGKDLELVGGSVVFKEVVMFS